MEQFLVKQVKGSELKVGYKWWEDGRWNEIKYLEPKSGWMGNGTCAVRNYKDFIFLVQLPAPSNKALTFEEFCEKNKQYLVLGGGMRNRHLLLKKMYEDYLLGFNSSQAPAEILIPSEPDIEAWVKEHGYWGTCTSDLHEGLTQGANWALSRLKEMNPKITFNPK